MSWTLSSSDVVAVLALLLAGVSFVQTARFNRRQNQFAETAARLNELLIARETGESAQQRRADVSANFVKVGQSNYRLKIFNRGEATAREINLELLDAAELISEREMQQKLPIPQLERHQVVELIASIHMNSPRRARLRLTWNDEAGAGHSKEMSADVF